MAKKNAAKKVKAKKPAPKAKPVKKAAPKKPVPKAKPVKKSAPKPATKKPAVKKPAPKKSAAKVAAKKPVAKKAVPKPTAKKVEKKVAAPAGKKGKGAPAKPEPKKPEKKIYIPDINRPTGMYGGVTLCSNPHPFPKKSPYSPKELSLLKQALMTERHRLRHELAQLEGMAFNATEGTNESPGHSVHIAEHASDMQSTETNLAVRALDEERLAQVEEALQRMVERQHYGLCMACGDKIGIERLIAKPHAHLCMDCRRKYEKERRF